LRATVIEQMATIIIP